MFATCLTKLLTSKCFQSEGGAAGSVHGVAARGALASTFTASQGLLLMIPNIYKCVGEQLPVVFHIAARSIATHALSIFGDHADIVACRGIGAPILHSNNVQEAADLSAIAHIASLKCSLPFIHSFDGKRTSDETVDIEQPSWENLHLLAQKFGTFEDVQRFRNGALDPEHPHMRGTSQDPSVYFQQAESANSVHLKVPQITADAMKAFEEIFGRSYKLYEWYGPQDADAAIISMGSSVSTIRQTLDFLAQSNPQYKKIGCLSVRLFRPFSPEFFAEALPKSVRRIAILDRCKEHNPIGEPLFTDIATTLTLLQRPMDTLVGGRYGLSSKEFTPAMVKAVADNLYSSEPKRQFTVGITDDVTNLSLPVGPEFSFLSKGTTECLFFGLGGDGQVSANHQALEIIVKLAKMHGQLFCFYDAVKNGTTTVSSLRIGPKPIDAPFGVLTADYIACTKQQYINRFLMVDKLNEGGIFLLNSTFKNLDDVNEHFPAQLKRTLAEKKAKLYLIDANKIATECGNKGRTNMVMQTAFFKLAGLVEPAEQALELLKLSVQERYKLKGSHVVEANIKMIDAAAKDDAIIPITYPESWKEAQGAEVKVNQSRNQFTMITGLRGDQLPVSSFEPTGKLEPGTSDWAKRGLAWTIPHWDADLCIQCNTCGFVCPHAVIRPFVLSKEEDEKKPETMRTIPTKGSGEVKKTSFRIQLSPYDCTGCSVCAKSCPVPGCLTMRNIEDEIDEYSENWDYCRALPNKGEMFNKLTMKGAIMQQPLLEFHGACAGCGETNYVRLLTQMYGPRMVIANATGCSSIWGGSYPSNPYTVDEKGHGPAWGNSLFEDNAEYGYGMLIAQETRRERLLDVVSSIVDKKTTGAELSKVLKEWFSNYNDATVTQELSERIIDLLKDNRPNQGVVTDPYEDLWNNRSLFDKKSQWLLGGDGWSYDIGFGGLDHVMSTGANINVLVVDTEVYSNTGGQTSKATQKGALHKFAMGGKGTFKKDLGRMFFAYEHVYVASVAMGASYAQTVKALKEAEEYDGPSIVIAYSPCIEHILTESMGVSIQNEKLAVETGYWINYRYDPRRIKKGLNPLQIDSKPPSRHPDEFLETNGRFRNLKVQFPEKADKVRKELAEWLANRWTSYQRMATPWEEVEAKTVIQPVVEEEEEQPEEEIVKEEVVEEKEAEPKVEATEESSSDKLSGQLLLAWGSETGTVEQFQEDLVERLRSLGVDVLSKELNDVSVDDLQEANLTFIMVSSTAGGEVPGNAEDFLAEMQELAASNPSALEGVRFVLFGFGDRTYDDTFQFGPLSIWKVMNDLGASPLMERGVGDAGSDDGIDGTFDPFVEEFVEKFL
ncbi:hypothetical protein GEMRC1_006932 [Eukaryota sp. GEM-RC1]